MRKISTAILLLTVSVTMIFSSCKKYEDGPSVSLATKKNRLCREWELKSASLGNFDVEQGNMENFTYEFRKNGTLTMVQEGVSAEGTWAFSNDKEDITITHGNDTQTLEIRRLTKKDLWLEDDDSEEIIDDLTLKFEAK